MNETLTGLVKESKYFGHLTRATKLVGVQLIKQKRYFGKIGAQTKLSDSICEVYNETLTGVVKESKYFGSLTRFQRLVGVQLVKHKQYFGKISDQTKPYGSLAPKLSDSIYEVYTEVYEIIPKAKEDQTLRTKNKLMRNDVVIQEIPYFEVSNDMDGTTIYIGGRE